MLTALITKLHTYAGLLTFVNLAIYGVVGLTAAFEPPPSQPPPAPLIQYMPYTPPPNATDREVAEQVRALLHLELARPVQPFVIQHDPRGNLVLDFRHANGRHRVTVFEATGPAPASEGRSGVRVEVTRSRTRQYLSSLHVTSAVFHPGDRRMQWFACYNEFAMWSLIGMTVSGAALWLLSRPGHRIAQVSFALGTVIFGALYFWTR